MGQVLLQKLLDKTITRAELEELSRLASTKDALDQPLDELWSQLSNEDIASHPNWDAKFATMLSEAKQIESETRPAAAIHRIHFRRLRWIAAAVVVFAIAGIFLTLQNRSAENQHSLAFKGDVAPGKLGTRIKLSDGRIIVIAPGKEGLIATDGTVEIFSVNGQIEYRGADSADETAYNEIFAQRGEQSSNIILPDGSKVWLNAASSIRYPLRFSKTERMVTMTGQAYFNVVHNAAQPFRVNAKGLIVEDIGTEFDINAYDDETVVKTTLIEGVASVGTANTKRIVRAGEQAVVKGSEIKVSAADVESATAWRRGYFSFDNDNLQSVMRKLSRWYDVEIRYEGKIEEVAFGGKIERSQTLAEVLKGLESMKIHFRIEEDKRIIVTP